MTKILTSDTAWQAVLNACACARCAISRILLTIYARVLTSLGMLRRERERERERASGFSNLSMWIGLIFERSLKNSLNLLHFAWDFPLALLSGDFGQWWNAKGNIRRLRTRTHIHTHTRQFTRKRFVTELAYDQAGAWWQAFKLLVVTTIVRESA